MVYVEPFSVSHYTQLLACSQRRIHFVKLNDDERRAATRAIGVSCREDYRDYVDGVLNDIEIAERGGNSREVSRLTSLISGKR